MTPENKRKITIKIIESIKNKDFEKVKYLSQYGAHTQIESVTDIKLFNCAMKDGSLEMISLLYEKGYFKGTKNNEILKSAIKRNDENVLEYFLNKGIHKDLINNNIKNSNDFSIIEYAFLEKNFDLVKKLMQYGYSVKNVRKATVENIIYFDKFESFDYIIEHEKQLEYTDRNRFLYIAIKENKIQFVELLLNKFEELRNEVKEIDVFEKRHGFKIKDEMEAFLNAFNTKVQIESMLNKPELKIKRKLKI